MKDSRQGLQDRRIKNVSPCKECGHHIRFHEFIWDPEALKSFWFCNACDRDNLGYPSTHHKPS